MLITQLSQIYSFFLKNNPTYHGDGGKRTLYSNDFLLYMYFGLEEVKKKLKIKLFELKILSKK